MGRLFNLDSPVMRFLSKMADLMILNLIVTICCIPIVTIGASVTAMHFVLLKMVRGEEGYIVRDYFKSFKMNFKQATVIWIIMMVLILVFVGDFWIVMYSGLSFPQGMQVILMAVGLLILISTVYVFPVLSRFENTIRRTIKNGCIMSIMAAPKSILMIVLGCLPAVVLLLTPSMIPIVLLFGFSAPAYVSAMLYSGTFRKFEPKEDEHTTDEEFHVVFEEGETPDTTETAETIEAKETFQNSENHTEEK